MEIRSAQLVKALLRQPPDSTVEFEQLVVHPAPVTVDDFDPRSADIAIARLWRAEFAGVTP